MSSCRKSCASMSVWDKRINPVISAESLDMTGFWRRVWDSNPRGLSPKLISNQPRYDHFDNPPFILTVFRSLEKCKKNRQEHYKIVRFESQETLDIQGEKGGRNSQSLRFFRVSPVMTTSIPLHIRRPSHRMSG